MRVSIVDSIELFAFHEHSDVVFDHGNLGHGGVEGPCGLSLDAIPKRKDILEL